MSLIKAYYKFKAYSVDFQTKMKVERLEKVGNYSYLNSMFEKIDNIWMHRVVPVEIEDYIAYVIEKNNCNVNWLPLIFETSTFHYPFGIVKHKAIKDIVLFRIINEYTFEVFVIEQKRYDSINYLQLMMDGHLQDEILKIQSKCI